MRVPRWVLAAACAATASACATAGARAERVWFWHALPPPPHAREVDLGAMAGPADAPPAGDVATAPADGAVGDAPPVAPAVADQPEEGMRGSPLVVVGGRASYVPGSPFTHRFMVTGRRKPPVTFSAEDGLPEGLLLDGGEGTLLGTPRSKEGFTVEVTATDADGRKATGRLEAVAATGDER